MFKDMDSQALMNSEVFRNLANQEIQHEAQLKHEASVVEKQALDNFNEFQKKVNASLQLKNQFKNLQQRFINEPEYRDTINEAFVRGVMLLKFED